MHIGDLDERRSILREQDLAYEESLQIDQAKVLKILLL